MIKVLTRPSHIVAYKAISKRPTSAWTKKPTSQKHDGFISYHARRKISNAIKWLIACSDEKQVYEKKQKRIVNWKINFITLTFKTNLEDDAIGRRCLMKWLDMASKRWNLKQYVWKAESQARGAIHFHITTNVYVPWAELRYTWNRILMKEGLVDGSSNSTDVHAVIDIKNLEAYLVNYIVNNDKSKGRRKIVGRLWGCSRDLSQAGKQYLTMADDERIVLEHELEPLSLHSRLRAQGKEIPKFLDFIDYYCMTDHDYNSMPDCELKQNYLNEIARLKARSGTYWKLL